MVNRGTQSATSKTLSEAEPDRAEARRRRGGWRKTGSQVGTEHERGEGEADGETGNQVGTERKRGEGEADGRQAGLNGRMLRKRRLNASSGKHDFH